MKRCRPPSSEMTSSPGRKCRWYVLPSRIVVPRARSSSGSIVFTVAFVPTGMNAGVGTSPCAVRRTPARAAPSVAVTSNRSLIDAHVPSSDEEVAAVLEAEALVVRTDPGIVAEAIEPEERAPGLRRLLVGPFDERLPDAASGVGTGDGELVDVRGVGWTLAPIHRVVPEQGHGRDDVALQLGD